MCTIFPSVVCARVSITEIAWMGVSGSSGQYGEWIELYNDGQSQDLAGWKLKSGGGTDIIFTLTKTIPENGYLLIERTTASMTDPVPGIPGESGSFGSGGLSNEGEFLTLEDTSGVIIESLNFSAGWPAGDATTKETMQRTSSGWVTALATPGAPTVGAPIDDVTGDTGGSTVVPPPASSSKKKEVVPHDPFITLNVPAELYQYVEHTFVADVVLEDGLRHRSGLARWNMGDGTLIEQTMLEPVTHRYRFPGTYVLWLGYYKDKTDKDPTLTLTRTIKVGTPALSVTPIGNHAVELTNLSGKTIDLSLWQLVSGGDRLTLPPYTFLAPDASITLSADTLGVDAFSNVQLSRPQGEIVEAVRESSPPQTPSLVRSVAVPQAQEVVIDDEPSSPLVAQAPQIRNRTKQWVFGAVSTILVILFILLERFMAKRE